jgi:hypothetical protein
MNFRLMGRVVLLFFALTAIVHSANAQHSKVWLALPERNDDYPKLFSDPQSWERAAQNSDVFSIGAGYVNRISSEDLKADLVLINRLGLKLDVGMSALPVDKKVCGDGLEGMVWPGEAIATARRLKNAGAQVNSFSFDLPLTNGHISLASHACRFSIREVAARLGSTMQALRSVYPKAQFVDVEVPTGMPAVEWSQLLAEWVADLRLETGEELGGFVLDIWWEFPWEQTLASSIQILHKRGIPVGTFIDVDRGIGADAESFPLWAKRNACRIINVSPESDFVVVANWMVPHVPLLPENDPHSLTALVNWYVSDKICTP